MRSFVNKMFDLEAWLSHNEYIWDRFRWLSCSYKPYGGEDVCVYLSENPIDSQWGYDVLDPLSFLKN